MKEVINPPDLFPSLQYGFSQIVATTGGKTVYLSGQVAWDERQQIVGDDLHVQTQQALRNVETAVRAAGGSLADVVSMRIYFLHGRRHETGAIAAGLKAFFPGDSPPATTWIGVPSLADEDFLVEIEAIAVVS